MVHDGSYITDYITGKQVRATAEEVDAVQVFTRVLVEDYGYPKDHIRTHPQFRVKVRPSDTQKEYPVDIAVFSTSEKRDGTELIIVECKKPNRRDGRSQLEDYLRFSRARIGVWFNGQEKLYLKKTEKDGSILFEEIPNIPKYGERLEDIGLYKRKDLKVTNNLKSIFRTIRNYLAANAVGITRDEVFAQQIINLIFCKIYDERFTKPEDTVKFRAGLDENPTSVRTRILNLFDHVKEQYSDVISHDDEILLDDDSLTYVVGELQMYCLIESERDAIADAFETFIGPSLKGGQGQFFTPRNVVKLIVKLVNPAIDDKIIDPACGSGGFLIESLRHVWTAIDERGHLYHWPENEIYAEKQRVAIRNIRGVDKDNFLSKVAKAYMAIIGDGRGGVFCENSLDSPNRWQQNAQDAIPLNSFDVVVTNPPFGKKLKVNDSSILSQYKLGHKWKKDRKTGAFTLTDQLHLGQAPQILFIERCLQLLRPGGRMGVIAPESMFCNPSHRYIVQYIRRSFGRIKAIISLPEELFQPYTHAKTVAVVIEKTTTDTEQTHDIFMAVAKWCGHDSRGLEIPHDDIPEILEKYIRYQEEGSIDYDHLGFVINEADIRGDIYLPKYYNPEIPRKLDRLRDTHDLLVIGDLVNRGILSITTGDEVGKLAYGTGNIPFVRTSDIANWEIKIDPKQGLSAEIYEQFKGKQDVQENDILMVRDGTYLVGTCAIVTSLDTKIVFQSHLYKIRSLDYGAIHPYLLLAVLSSPIVREQIYAKRFAQDIIDTLGGRIHELILPIPNNASVREQLIAQVSKVIQHKIEARIMTRNAILSVAPYEDFDDDFAFLTLRD